MYYLLRWPPLDISTGGCTFQRVTIYGCTFWVGVYLLGMGVYLLGVGVYLLGVGVYLLGVGVPSGGWGCTFWGGDVLGCTWHTHPLGTLWYTPNRDLEPGIPAPWKGTWDQVYLPAPPPEGPGQTHACEKITFQQLSWRVVTKSGFKVYYTMEFGGKVAMSLSYIQIELNDNNKMHEFHVFF